MKYIIFYLNGAFYEITGKWYETGEAWKLKTMFELCNIKTHEFKCMDKRTLKQLIKNDSYTVIKGEFVK